MRRDPLQVLVRTLRRSIYQEQTGLTDNDLLERFVGRGDEAAFEMLVWRHGPMVLGVCRRVLRHHQDSEDAFQATFLTLVKKSASISRREALGSWLYQVAYRIALRSRADSARRTRHESAEAGQSPEAVVPPAWDDWRLVLDEELRRLPERYRSPVVLCYLQGKTNEEAARELDCPPGTVMSRLAWARERLRGRLAQRGVTLTVAGMATMLSETGAPAAITTTLVHGTVDSVMTLSSGKVLTAGLAAERVLALTTGVMHSMFLSKLKTATLVLVSVLAVGSGAGVVAYRKVTAAAEAQVEAQPEPPPAPRAQRPAEVKLPADLDMVPRDAWAVASFRISDFWKKEIWDAEAKRLTGLSLSEIERATLVVNFSDDGAIDRNYWLVSTTRQVPRTRVVQAIVPHATKKEHQGTSYFTGLNRGQGVGFPGDRLFVVGDSEQIPTIIDELAKKQADGPLGPVLQLAARNRPAVAGLNVPRLAALIADRREKAFAELMAPFLPLLQTRLALLTLEANATPRVTAQLTFESKEQANDALKPAKSALALLRPLLDGFAETSKKERSFSAGALTLIGDGATALNRSEIELRGVDLRLEVGLKGNAHEQIQNTNEVIRESITKITQREKQVRSSNNLRQLGISMIGYLSDHGHFPPSIVYSKDGKPLYSWRVLMLPYILGEDLFKEFKHDEAWDSEHNKKLLPKMPQLFAPVSGETKEPYSTYYQVFHGEGAAFEGKDGLPLDKINDARGQTILVIEAGEAVPWTKPVDLPYSKDKPLPKVGGLFTDVIHAAFADGSSQRIKKPATEELLRALITRNGGEVIGKLP